MGFTTGTIFPVNFPEQAICQMNLAIEVRNSWLKEFILGMTEAVTITLQEGFLTKRSEPSVSFA